MDKEKLEEEKRRRHERRKERKEREAKEGKTKDGKSVRPKKAHGLDLIDKLDVTGIYGQGCEYRIDDYPGCRLTV